MFISTLEFDIFSLLEYSLKQDSQKKCKTNIVLRISKTANTMFKLKCNESFKAQYFKHLAKYFIFVNNELSTTRAANTQV